MKLKITVVVILISHIFHVASIKGYMLEPRIIWRMSTQRKFPKFYNHPDNEELVELMESGEQPNEIALMLKMRYPGDKSKCMTHSYLYQVRKDRYPVLAARKRMDKYNRRTAKQQGKEPSINAPQIDIATRIMILTGQEPKPPEPIKDIPNDQLLSWMNGIDGFKTFTEEMIIERGEPVTLQDYQIEMADHFINHSRVCINGAGQIGKDFMMQNFIIWWALTHAGSLQMVLCATQAQSVALKRRIEDKIGFSVDLQMAYSQSGMKPVPIVTLKNGSIILFLTAKSTVAGYTNVDIIYINEARDVKESEVTRVTPLLGIGGGRLFVLSRPRFRRGYFWDCYSNPAFTTMQIPTERNIHFDRKVLEDDRATLSPDLFKIEYLAEFADAGSSWFSEKAVDICSKVDYDFTAMIADKNYEYSLGIDPARLRDTSAYVMIGRHKKVSHSPRYKVAIVHGFSPDQAAESSFRHQQAWINLLNSGLVNSGGEGLKYIVPEYVGLGIPFTEDLQDYWRLNIGSPSLIHPFEVHSLAPKIEMYNFAKNIVEVHDIEIPRGAFRLINEMKMTQFGVTPMGKVRVETPVTDDYIDAFCLSLMGFKKPFEIGIASARTPPITIPGVVR